MSGKILRMNPKDNVGMVLQDANPGDALTVLYEGQPEATVTVKDATDIYHKVALAPIKTDEYVVKYGELIGVATQDIAVGEHVHVFNVRSIKV
ncbi:MAG: UxaA family hydrolase [Lactobacillus sp.]|jgi:altronate dehydratase small subunit|nr:UxaA family hydrolase [Lactobacillus sp.]MCI2033417.1 UxaA family hydrolase [Lactobacillus sp.]